MNEDKYGKLISRVKAIFIDVLVLAGLGLAATKIFSMFGEVSDNTRLATFIFIFVLYDPIFTSTVGGTIGHFFIGLRVRREKDENKKIILPLAIVRFILKDLLGWISLLTVSGNKKKKALHDLVVGSVVVQLNA